ncbi:MAG: hypothetical protein R3F31_23370 [Verrucomicrobiales bacterium]
METKRQACDARTGHVAVMVNPLEIKASSSVSQPVVKSHPFIVTLIIPAIIVIILFERIINGQRHTRVERSRSLVNVWRKPGRNGPLP